MSDIVKWGLLAAAAAAVVALIVALPFNEFLNVGELSAAISNVVTIAGSAFTFGRGLINNLFLPFGRKIASGLMIWLIAKWVLMIGIKTATWAAHFIFK